MYWVNLSKRGEMDRVFRGVALPAQGKPRSFLLSYLYLQLFADPGEARGCFTNTYVIH